MRRNLRDLMNLLWDSLMSIEMTLRNFLAVQTVCFKPV